MRTYWNFSKPRVWLIFVLEGLAGSVLAWHTSGVFPWLWVGVAMMAIARAAAGAEALTNVLDRSLDAVMLRTRMRPLPRGTITPREAISNQEGPHVIVYRLLWLAHWHIADLTCHEFALGTR